MLPLMLVTVSQSGWLAGWLADWLPTSRHPNTIGQDIGKHRPKSSVVVVTAAADATIR